MSLAAPEVAGFVLAGGRSTRMGEDKALVELAGRPLIAHGLNVLRGAGLQPRIAGKHAELSGFAPVIADEHADRGPLGGVVSALAQASGELAVFVSIDMPLMAPGLVATLIENAKLTECSVTLASVNAFAQTFPAVIRRECLPVLRAELEIGHGGCFAAFEEAARARGERLRVLPAEALMQAGQATDALGLWPYQWFLNLNTCEELRQASAAFRGRIA